jgi:flagellar assembly protein FliH
MSLSKLLSSPAYGNKIIIGEYRSDIEADRRSEKEMNKRFLGLTIITTTEGKKLVPIQELVRIEKQFQLEQAESDRAAYERGKDDGYKAGLEEGHREAQEVIKNFSGVVSDITGQRESLLEEARQKILNLVIQISKKVTFEAAQVDPEVTAAIINGAINSLIDKRKIKVKVNPAHLPHIEQQIDRFKGETTAVKELIIEPDARVRYGGCFIETPSGDIDARVDSQMEIVTEALIEDKE